MLPIKSMAICLTTATGLLTIIIFMVTLMGLPIGSNANSILDLLHHHSDTEDKVELVKKVGTALALAYRSKKFMVPLPFPVPVPIPIYKSYQAVIHDPWFYKKQLLTGGLTGGYGGFAGGGGIGGSGALTHLAALGKLGGIGGGLGGLGHGLGGHGLGSGGLGALGGIGGLGGFG